MSNSLKWNGDALKKKLREAQIAGVNETMGECVVHAKDNHPWVYRTPGGLESSIDVAEYAAPDGDGVKGSWGSLDNEYALIQELGGTIKHPGGTPYVIGKDGKAEFVRIESAGAADLPKTKPHEIVLPARPYLRPAADAKYPNLQNNIRKAFGRQSAPKGVKS